MRFLLLLLLLPYTSAAPGPWRLPSLRQASFARRSLASSPVTRLNAPTTSLLLMDINGGDVSQDYDVEAEDSLTGIARDGEATVTSSIDEDFSIIAAEEEGNVATPSTSFSGGAAAAPSASTAKTTRKTAANTTSSKSPSAPVKQKITLDNALTREEKKELRQEKKEEKKAIKVAKKAEKYHKKVAKKLRNRNASNGRRKVMHACFGILFAGLNHAIPKQKFVPGMAVLSSATLLMELLRYRKNFEWMNQALHFVLGKALRKNEMDGKFTGSFYFFTGVTLTSALYPTTAATMGILQLALADPSASYFGRKSRHVYWSRIENGLGGIGRNKGLLGFLGGALFCWPFNYRIFSIAKFGPQGIPGGKVSLAVASLALGVAGAFADLAVPTPAWTLPKRICGVRVPPFHLDDNFAIPIFSGYACTQIFRILNWDQNLQLAHFIFT